MTYGNRRASTRRKATKELLVRFRKIGLFSFLRPYRECEVVDFFRNGLGFISNDKLEKYETIQLDISYRFKRCKGVKGIIVHKKTIGGHSFRYGLMFKDLEKTAQDKLNEIEEMLS